MQWHPFFAALLEKTLGSYYEVTTEESVGELPRSADFVIIRRTGEDPPFREIWRYLSEWNVVEFKGPTDYGEIFDIDELVEVGIGVHRHRNTEREKQKQPLIHHEQLSWWYMAPFGETFLEKANRRLGKLNPMMPGAWQGSILEHPIYLVDYVEFPLTLENLPFQIITPGNEEQEQAKVRFLTQNSMKDLTEIYQYLLQQLTQDKIVNEQLRKEIEEYAKIVTRERAEFAMAGLDIPGFIRKALDAGGLENLPPDLKLEIQEQMFKKQSAE